MPEKKVCPECGTDSFSTTVRISERFIINGEGDVISREMNQPDHWKGSPIYCTSCENEFTDLKEELVTEAYFHEHIAVQSLD